MADDITVDNGTLTDYIVSADDASGALVQRVKLAASADGSAAHIPADATDGLLVNLGANNDVVISDGGNVISVDNGGTFAVQVDGSALTSLQLIDDIVYTDDTSTHATGTSKGVGMMAAATPTDGSVNANDIGMVAMTTDRKLHVAVQDALPAGSNAVGKLAANDGVDIGDVTVNNASGASAVNIQDGGNSITVDYATTGAGTATGALRVELPTNGTGVIATVGAVTAITNALPAGTNAIGKLAANSGVDIGDTDVTSIIAGTGATNLGKAEDAVAGSGDTGVFALAVRRDTPTSSAAAGDYHELEVDSSGRLFVRSSPLIAEINASLTSSTSPAYSVNDCVGGVITFSSVAAAAGRPFSIQNIIITDKGVSAPSLELHLFQVSPTMAGADNAAFDMTDANMLVGLPKLVVEFNRWYKTASNEWAMGSVLGGGSFAELLTGATANFFGVLVTRTIFTGANTTDFRIDMVVEQY